MSINVLYSLTVPANLFFFFFFLLSQNSLAFEHHTADVLGSCDSTQALPSHLVFSFCFECDVFHI